MRGRAHTCASAGGSQEWGSLISGETSPANTSYEAASSRHCWRGFSHQVVKRSAPMGGRESWDWTSGRLSEGRLWEGPRGYTASRFSAAARWGPLLLTGARCHSLAASLPPLPWAQPAFWLSCPPSLVPACPCACLVSLCP